MAHAYCRDCNAEMSPPTVHEAFEDDYRCPSCDEVQVLTYNAKTDIINDIIERLNALEGSVDQTGRKPDAPS